jgi:gliding motility-associated-like protein
MHAQKCATNLDFENANTLFWECDTGRSSVNGNTYFLSGELPNRHSVIRNSSLNLDPYGKFPINCPNGSGYTLMLGNNSTGAQTEKVSYTFTIPTNANVYSLIYWYAVVFQNPGHAPAEQPKFNINVTDLTTNQRVDCASFEYVVSKNLPGFETSTVQANVEFKKWTPVTVTLSNKGGHVIKIEFSTSDCTRGGHFGYAYVDIDSDCGLPLKGAGYCSDVDTVELAAPFGYKAYQWYTNNFQDLISSQSKVVLSPPPPVGSKYAVVLIPYDGFGCLDTLNTVIKSGYIPPFVVSDKQVCEGDSVLLDVGFNNSAFSYNWLPVIGIRNPDLSKTFATPKETIVFKLKVIDTASGCTKERDINIEVIKQNPAVVIKGDTIACGIKPYTAQFTLVTGSTIQWHINDIAIPGENGSIFSPKTAGLYKATLQTAGCLVSTRNIQLRPSKSPISNFNLNSNTQCLTGNNFLATSANAGVYPITRLWDWGNGKQDNNDSIKNYIYPEAGNYRLVLTSTTKDGCLDTIGKNIIVDAPPALSFNVENPCEKTLTNFINTTPTIAGSNISFSWSLGNSNTIYNTVNASNNYLNSGSYNVNLKAVTINCLIPVELNKRVTIFAAPSGRKKIVTTAFSIPTTIETINKGVQYKWIPAVNLNDNLIANPIFSGPASAIYLVEIVNQIGCNIIDTVSVQLFDKISILVPTAFTPNGDGKNDRLSPILIGIDNMEYFRIWNRWGVLVYETKTPKPGWDGTYNGIKQEPGTFVWEGAAIGIGGVVIKKEGLVTLLR